LKELLPSFSFGSLCGFFPAKELIMKKEEFRNYSALLILTVLIDRTTEPAKAAVFWADELIKELYSEESQ
jgi:hypothetical protein